MWWFQEVRRKDKYTGMEYIRVSVEVNGVIRGGAYSHVSLRNSVFRRNGSYPQAHSYESISVGFRCEWCNKGRQSIYYGY